MGGRQGPGVVDWGVFTGDVPSHGTRQRELASSDQANRFLGAYTYSPHGSCKPGSNTGRSGFHTYTTLHTTSPETISELAADGHSLLFSILRCEDGHIRHVRSTGAELKRRRGKASTAVLG